MIIFISSIFLILDWRPTYLLWNRFKAIQIVDIPWRFLGISAVASSFLAAFVSRTIKPGFLFLLLVCAVLISNRNHLRINKAVDVSDDFFENYQGSATQLNEFTPYTRNGTSFHNPLKIEVAGSKVDISAINERSNRLSFTTDSAVNSQIRVNTLYFPGWNVYRDQQKLVINSDYFINSNPDRQSRPPDRTGVFILNVPSGIHHYRLNLTETPIRRVADLISLISLLFAIFFIFELNKRPLKNKLSVL